MAAGLREAQRAFRSRAVAVEDSVARLRTATRESAGVLRFSCILLVLVSTAGCGEDRTTGEPLIACAAVEQAQAAGDLVASHLAEELRLVPAWLDLDRPPMEWAVHNLLLTSDRAPCAYDWQAIGRRIALADLVVVCDLHDMPICRSVAARSALAMDTNIVSRPGVDVLLEAVLLREQDWLDKLSAVGPDAGWPLFKEKIGAASTFGVAGYEELISLVGRATVRLLAVGLESAVGEPAESYRRRVARSVGATLSAVARTPPEVRRKQVLLIGVHHVLRSPSVLDHPGLDDLSVVVLVPAQLQWLLTIERRWPGVQAGVWLEVAPAVFCYHADAAGTAALLRETCARRPRRRQDESVVDVLEHGAPAEQRRVLRNLVDGLEAGTYIDVILRMQPPAEADILEEWIRCLGAAKSSDAHAAQTLLRYVRDGRSGVARSAALALRMMAPVHPRCVEAMAVAQVDAGLDEQVRHDLSMALGSRLLEPATVPRCLTSDLRGGLEEGEAMAVVRVIRAYGVAAGVPAQAAPDAPR